MSLAPQTRDDLLSRLAELSGWQTATRDDGKVAQELHATRSLDRVHALNEVAFFGELFQYLREIGVWPLLEALMGLLGFNAVQVREGSTQRGVDRRTNPIDIRGPFSFETGSGNIVVIGPEKLAAMVNGVIRCLAGQGIFAKDLDVMLDGTDNEATPTYQTDDDRAVPHVCCVARPPTERIAFSPPSR